jgi:pimeloyl-ACP methyl ester carboxylesterase
MIADHTRDETMSAMAQRILSNAPPRFALAGLSMGGYICFEVMRQAPTRIERLALLDTSARPDTAEATANRKQQIGLAARGRLTEIADTVFERLVAPGRQQDTQLRELNRLMMTEVGAEAFTRQ